MSLKLYAVLALFFFVACTQKQNEKKSLSLIQDAQKIVSTRGSDEDQFFALLKLKAPALLETSKRINGVTVIDQNIKLEIEAEQALVVQELQKLSPSVQVVYRYKMVLNAVAVVGPRSVFEKMSQIGLVASWEKVGNFERIIVQTNPADLNGDDDLTLHNSSKFIGAEELNRLGLTGKGIKVGVIDTGIDYTHVMFGGSGTEAGYKAVNPDQVGVGYPSSKVVGGVDLVGTLYNAASPDFSLHIPKPDLNPIDEAAHGSHVAGTIAGRGDLIESYNGMAPDADLYAIKVFGADGSTSDMVVIAGLEFAADPNGDGKLEDQLDIVNLSLGSSYGTPKLLYAEAVKNLVLGGTSAIMSAGNSGNIDYIVGSPGATTEALSVASSVDDTEHNWKFKSSIIKLDQNIEYVEVYEAATTQPIEAGTVDGDFYYIGFADKDLTAEQITGLAGKVALIDRGVVNFNDKVSRAADGGAIGVVVMNNQSGTPLKMGTTDQFSIPAIMITQEMGQKIKVLLNGALAMPNVGIQFKSDKKIEKPELIDTISSFSSKGPRSIDGHLKPEIAAPGTNIISAGFGTGNKFVQMSGTSMAAPHMSGVMALIKQGYKDKGLDLSAIELKNIAMGNAKTMFEKGKIYPISRQGAGRVEANAKTINSPFVAEQASVSFGEVSIATKRNFKRKIQLKSLTDESLSLSVVFEGHAGVKLFPVAAVTLMARKTASIELNFELDSTLAKSEVEEFDGLIKILDNAKEVYRLPLLAVVHKQAHVTVEKAVLDVTSGQVTLDVKNINAHDGQALFFNLLSGDARKLAPKFGRKIFNTDCDLQSAGYRVVNKKDAIGVEVQFIQFAFKTFKPMTTWNYCDVSVLFDSNNDGQFDQELVGTNLKNIPNQTKNEFSSILIDTAAAKKIRLDFENEVRSAKGDPKKMEALAELEDYTTALQDIIKMTLFNNTTLIMVEADLSLLQKDTNNNLNFKVLSSYYVGSPAEFDDYVIKSDVSDTFTISMDPAQHPFYGFSDNRSASNVNAVSRTNINLNKGSGIGDLIGYYPQNVFTFSDVAIDKQSQVIKLK